ncbi:acyl carrier protein [Lachnospiraceae bacterium 50-23]
MRDEILDGVKGIIEEMLQENYRGFDQQITEDMGLREDIGLDSIDLVVLQVEIEDQWDIRFNPLEDDFLEIFDSINSLCEFLKLRLDEKFETKR